MSGRLSVLMTVYNEGDFVEYAIRAALPYVDDLVVVEGAYQETIALGANPRSTDGTLNLLVEIRDLGYIRKHFDIKDDKDIMDLYCKLHIIQANEKTDKDQRNIGLERIKQLNPDGWLLIIDGDEVYTKENFDMIRNYMKTMEKQDKRAAYFKSLTFVNGFDQYAEQEFPRLFRITPGCKFVDDNYMVWEDKGWSLQTVMKLPYVRYHHFAFCKSKERFELKKKWWETRFPDQPNFDYGWHINSEGKFDDLNHQIRPYTGQLPETMKTHPLYKEKQ